MSGPCSSYAIEGDSTSGGCSHPAGYKDSGDNDYCACHYGPPYDPAECDPYRAMPGLPIHLPVDDKVIALVKLPIAVTPLYDLGKLLERVYGPDLVLRTDTNIEGWLVFSR